MTEPVSQGGFPGQQTRSVSAQNGLDQVGVKVEGVISVVELGLRGGSSPQFTLSSSDRRKLADILRNWPPNFLHQGPPEIPFFWFESEFYSVCLNLTATVYVRHIVVPPSADPVDPTTIASIEETAPSILAWMVGQQKPLEFSATPDEFSDQDDDEGSAHGQLKEILLDLDGYLSGDGFVSFVDKDGQDVFLRVADVALIAIPQWLLKPDEFEKNITPDDEPIETEGSQGGPL